MQKQKVGSLKQFAVWDASQGDDSYWLYFDSLEDAVNEGGDGGEVFVFQGRSLGKFKRKVELVKVKRRKKRKQA